MRIDPAVDRRTARIAERFYGFLTPEQLAAAGHTRASVRTRADNGLLEPWGRLFHVAGAPHSWQGDAYAAVANGPTGTVARALTAAALYGVWAAPVRPQIIVPSAGNARRIDCAVQRSDLDPQDVTRVGLIPATTPARTLVDAAAVLRYEQLCELVDAFLVARLTTVEQIEAAMARASTRPGRKGLPALRRALEIWAPGMEHDSVAEARLFRLLASWGFPLPVPLYVIRTPDGAPVCEVDAAWPTVAVALEYDSTLHHHERRWARDEARATAATALGWTVVPVDKTDLRPGGHDRFRSRLTEVLSKAA